MTKSVKIKAKRAKLRHILTTKNRKKKRNMRKSKILDSTNVYQVRRLLPYA